MILLAVGWYLRFSLSYRGVEDLWLSEACTPITSRSGGGCRGMPRNWNDAYDKSCGPPMTVGGWTLTYIRVKASGSIYIGQWIRAARRSTYKDAAYPLAIVQLKSEAALEENCCHRPVQYLEQCSGAGSSADQASGPRESAFPLLLGSLAYNRWLRGHSYDSQGQAWGSAAGAKVGMLHHFILGLFAAN